MNLAVASSPAPQAAAPAAAAAPPEDLFDLSFSDLLDVVNPLQHIPIVSTIYRALTGDHIKTLPKIVGDTLYGGATGFVSSVADTIFEKVTGKSLGDTVLADVEDLFSSSDTPPTGVAANSPDLGHRIIASIESLFSSDDAPAAVASTAVAPATPVAAPGIASLGTITIPGQDALLNALSLKGISSDLALRAAQAYRNTVDPSTATQPPRPLVPLQ